ncbi:MULTISPECIES: flagellar export chaperone FliS [unclassified Paenibacillus]|uniref:flagellar export chaperone FliS n=1 Tax=unclassified Paenibacillus TaxID=185978 RepID=UPI00040F6DF9|nr:MULTISPECIES: flagellar export chaperone FliS [unclassified Paenibacillus]KGP80867.1 flagellar biosynthesis protein FliS [Paenibacillus sp. MAEPY2]KGP88032.1 flagellar biosynthesis protein FliS [Paenibacillus sp. MAEPY1]
MITSPYEKYKQSSVQTSTPGQLVIMLYDGAIRFVKVGLEGISSKDYMKANVNLGKAQTIISELMSTLDHSYPVSKNLFSMYEYMNHLLIQSNIKKVTQPAEEALNYLQELRETWIVANKQYLGTSMND